MNKFVGGSQIQIHGRVTVVSQIVFWCGVRHSNIYWKCSIWTSEMVINLKHCRNGTVLRIDLENKRIDYEQSPRAVRDPSDDKRFPGQVQIISH